VKQHPLKFFENYSITPRQQQVDVLEQVEKSWDKYKYTCLSLPTGVGKSYIACAIADSVGRAYILTSTLQLQTQYESSWSKIVNLKGRSNYTCNLNPMFTVDAAPCTAQHELVKVCLKSQGCSYYAQKQRAMNSQAMITNPVYMLYSSHCGFAKEKEADDEGGWVKRDVLIVDEAHNLESHLVQFAESDIDPQQLHDDYKVPLVEFSGKPEEDYFKIITLYEELLDAADALAAKLEEEFPKKQFFDDDAMKHWARGFGDKVADRVKKLQVKAYKLDKTIQPLKIFFSTHGTPEELTKRWVLSKYPDKNVVKLAPIYGDFLFEAYLGGLADKFVFLSATLGSKQAFCHELGIKDEECLFIETDSPFPPERSPVIVMPAIKLSRDVYAANVQKIGPILDEILEIHKGERGVCHCVTYDLQKEIYNRVSEANKRRFLCRDMDILSEKPVPKGQYPRKYKNEELLQIHTHQGRSTGSVLLSPSMMEGVDLYDDLSRFQVIIKLPWANLGDVRVATKSKLDRDWYTNKLWLSVLQACGRSTRHQEDSSTTYIIDLNFEYFFNQWKHNLPSWFTKRLVFS
jgi:Rad3-related DNA helicase